MTELYRKTPDDRDVYICIPDSVRNPNPAVIACHGSGREALSYRDVPFYQKQRDLVLESGCLFACVSNERDTYGTTAGMKRIEWLYQLLTHEYQAAASIALFASSAGGLMMQRYFQEHPHQVKLLLGVFPIFDPQTQPAIPSFLAAYDALDEQELRGKIEMIAPGKLPSGFYRDVYGAVSHGRQDTAVPIEQSRAFLSRVLSDGGRMELAEVSGGHSTENFALYDTPIFKAALQDFYQSAYRH